MADRRAGRIPNVRAPGGGLLPRARNKDGRWRMKRSDAGQVRNGNGRASVAVRVAA